MKRPAFQFYPGDWMRSTDLRSCSVGARGLWIDMICLMHEGTPYGYLKVNSKVILPANLARIVGATLPEVEGWIAELLDAGVCSVDDDKSIYCRRMIRDEQVREKRASGGKLGGNPALMKPAKEDFGTPERLTTKDNQKPTPASASSFASAKNKTLMSGKPDGTADGALPADDLASQAKGILAHLNQRTGKSFRPVPANLALVLARLKEGNTAASLRAMVDAKVAEWKHDASMCKYLRPKTLFNATNCNQYLGELPANGKSGQQPDDWWTPAGFANQWEAENAGCHQHNAKCFRGGAKFMGAVQ